MCATDWDRWRQELKKAGLPLPPKPRRREPETAAIYALLDPGTRIPRYVGHSADPARRLKEHWRRRAYAPYAEDNPKFSAWLCSLDGPPELEILQVVPYEDRFEAERHHTDLLRETPGVDLLNIFSGSEVPEATRAKMSARMQGTRASAETRAKISAGMKTYLDSLAPEQLAEVRRNLTPRVRGFLGKKHSPETLVKMSLAQKARFRRERMSAWDPDDGEGS